MNTRSIKFTGLLILLTAMAFSVTAQLNLSGAQYYVNEYIANPALAGRSQGFKINGAYRALWNNIPGAPVSQYLTADYGFKKVGLGINLYNESAGLTKQTRMVATYAYSIKIAEENNLRFGVSAGFMSQALERDLVNGNTADPMIGSYNARKTYFDGDFGVAFNSGNFAIQASIPNLKNFFKRDVIKLADENNFYSAVSYKMILGGNINSFVVEPKLVYRNIRGFSNLWDAGLQASIANQEIFFTGIYHNTKSATLGIGMDFKKKYLISGLYTTQTSQLGSYTNGSFELNLRLSFGK